MELTITTTPTELLFDYVPTRFDNAVAYGVWAGGKAPTNAWRNTPGRFIGDVVKFADHPDRWYAAYTIGMALSEADWRGPFPTRHTASVWLLGYNTARLA